MSNAAVDIFVHVSVWTHVFIPLGHIPKSRIAGSYDNSVFNSLRDHQTVLHKNYKRTVTLGILNLLICVRGMFLHIYSFKNFFHQCLIVFSIQVLHMFFVGFIPELHIFWRYCKWYLS